MRGTVKRVGDLKEALAKGDRKGIGDAAAKSSLSPGSSEMLEGIAGHANAVPEKVFSERILARLLSLVSLISYSQQ